VVLAARQSSETAHGRGCDCDRVSGKEYKVESFQIRERAQGLVEYGLIIALVAVLAIAGLIIFGPAVSALLSKLGGSV
jgi:Flp pilus assembly pilin Flp